MHTGPSDGHAGGSAEAVKDKLRVLIVDEQQERTSALTETLEQVGCQVVARLHSAVDLHGAIEASQPDVVIVDMDSPDRDTLEDMRRITAERPRPIVMFVEEDDPEQIRQAVRAGVAAYVVKGSDPARVRPVLDVACARFEEFQALKDELARAKSSLEDRASIERAKGILMDRRKLTEQEAFAALRKLAMDRRKRMGEVARDLISAADLL